MIFRRFVKGLTGRVIDGPAECRVTAETLHMIQVGMPARNDQGQKGKLHRLFKKRGEEMPFDVVHADKGNTAGKGHRLGDGKPHQQSTGQARVRG